MIKRKEKFYIPEYREKKEAYELLGFKEKVYKEKGINCVVTFEIEDFYLHNRHLKELKRRMNRKGPTFYPVFILIGLAFILLSVFVILLGYSYTHNQSFDLIANSLTLLLPAFILIAGDVAYMIYYFKAHERLIQEGPISPRIIVEEIKKVRNIQ